MFTTARALLIALLCVGVLGTRVQADLVSFVVERREAFANQAQPYEKLTGRFHGELNPTHPLNAIITDIALAPRNARGMVEYSATFTIVKPIDLGKASGVLVYQVPNRGRANIEAQGTSRTFARSVMCSWRAAGRPTSRQVQASRPWSRRLPETPMARASPGR